MTYRYLLPIECHSIAFTGHL